MRTDVRKPHVGCYDEVRRLVTQSLDGCALARCTLQTRSSCLRVFKLTKNMKYTRDRKFIEV